MKPPPAPWLRRGRIARPFPLLGPSLADHLVPFPAAKLRAACEARGLAAPPQATRRELAQLLTRDKLRADAEEWYRRGEVPFPEHDRDYPVLCRMIAAHGLGHVLDLGCGPGLFAAHALGAGGLPADGSYLGVDNVAGAIELARRRFAGDRRARFELCDLATELPRAPRVDCVVLAFVLPYLDTHAADRLLRRIARAWPDATLLVAVSVLVSLNGPEEHPPKQAMRHYLDGDRRALARWDTRRLLAYTRAVDDHFGIIEEHRSGDRWRVLFWLARRSRRPRQAR